MAAPRSRSTPRRSPRSRSSRPAIRRSTVGRQRISDHRGHQERYEPISRIGLRRRTPLDWNANSQVNILNGDPKPVSKQRDFGFSIGGPVGKPGGANKLFFFYAQELNPRSIGGDVVRFRMPTALERAGDFSQTLRSKRQRRTRTSKTRTKTGTCSAASQAACFNDGGVVGRIPASQLYSPGQAILNWWPLPTIPNAAGLAYNYEQVRPIEDALGYQPVLKVDYQPLADVSVSAASTRPMVNGAQTFLGRFPGFTDSRPSRMITPSIWRTMSYTVEPHDLRRGHRWGTHPNSRKVARSRARRATSVRPSARVRSRRVRSPNYKTAGFRRPAAAVSGCASHRPLVSLRSSASTSMNAPMWDGTRLWRAPTFAWGNRIANTPPGSPFPGSFKPVARGTCLRA